VAERAGSLAVAPPNTLSRPRTTRLPRFLRHRSAVVGGIVLVLVVLTALLAPFLATYSPTLLAPEIRLQPPSPEHLFGTDNQGRDTYSRTVFGAQVSLQVGFGVALTVVLFGLTIGLLTGYFRRVDGPLMRVMDGLMAFPGVILAVAIMAAIGPRKENVIVALSVVSIPRLARVVRSVVLGIRELQYIEAARTLGITTTRILLRHILPNCLAPVIVQSTFIFCDAVLGEAGLSFLGVGTPPEIPSWGNMLGDARAYLPIAPWTMLAPGAALMIAVLGLNLLGDGIRDLLDPRLRRLE
jgi:peptide/nickel transport system permease protein